MQLEPDACFRATRARDARFDGRFFVGITSTRI
jgi:AraC family transcriptional regulator of adaptative response / DNA-3-methyladenine glycosylase II